VVSVAERCADQPSEHGGPAQCRAVRNPDALLT
jgi:hypothetical protein